MTRDPMRDNVIPLKERRGAAPVATSSLRMHSLLLRVVEPEKPAGRPARVRLFDRMRFFSSRLVHFPLAVNPVLDDGSRLPESGAKND